jgi:hypothetical protein
MSIIQQTFKTVTCNGPECKNTATFEAGSEQAVAEEKPWFKTLRMVQTAQGRNYVYCSDACEIANVAVGLHNPEERKNIIVPEGANAMAQAEQQAKIAEAAARAMKAGPVLVK